MPKNLVLKKNRISIQKMNIKYGVIGFIQSQEDFNGVFSERNKGR